MRYYTFHSATTATLGEGSVLVPDVVAANPANYAGVAFPAVWQTSAPMVPHPRAGNVVMVRLVPVELELGTHPRECLVVCEAQAVAA